MWQRMTFALTVVPLGLGGGALALFVRFECRTRRGSRFLLCCRCGNRASLDACFWDRRSSQAVQQRSKRTLSRSARKLSTYFPCWVVCSRGRPSYGIDFDKLGAQARFGTVMLGGVVFSTAAALTVLPVVIARVAK